MSVFTVKPEIHQYAVFKEFVQAFDLGKDDLVFTHEFLYEAFMKPLGLNCSFLFQEKFGTGEPSDEMVDTVLEEAHKIPYQRVIAVGGGSVVDIAKMMAVKRPAHLLDFFDGAAQFEKARTLVVVPTTCGTGSEVTNLAVFELKSRKVKKGIGSNCLYPDQAVLIPELVKGLPYPFFIYSSVDALVHATECYVSPKATAFSELFSLEAARLILRGYQTMIQEGRDSRFDLIGDFLLASTCAGIAFCNAGVGAVHAMAYPLGGGYHVAHGESNYAFFLDVFELYNKKAPGGKLQKLKNVLGEVLGVPADESVFKALDGILSSLLKRKPLREYGMKEADCAGFAKKVVEGQQRLLANTYVPITEEEISAIYTKLY